MRKLLIGIVVLLVLLVAAAFVGPRFVPADSLKADIAEQVRSATGRDLIIDGDLSFTLLPAPGVSVSGVRLTNSDGAQASEMVQLEAAQVAVALGPLFSGNIEIERIVLVEPVFELEQFADGSNNWTFEPAGGAAGAGDAGSGTSSGGGIAQSVQLNDLVVRDGTLVFRTPDRVERIEQINASFGAGSLQGPFRADGELVVRGRPAQLRTTIGELISDGAIPVNFTTGVGGAEITYAGILSGFPAEPRISGELEGTASDLAELIAALTGAAPSGLPASGLSVKGDIAADQSSLALNNLSLDFAGISATGAVNAALGATPQFDAVVNIGQLDLDKLLADLASAAPAGDGPIAPGGEAPAGATAGAEKAFALPTAIDASVEAKADIVRFRGGVIRQAGLNADLADGELTISQLTAQLPGSADLSVFGIVSARDGVPAFSGQGEANADDLRGLLAWLGVQLPDVPLDRLRKLALTASVDGTAEKLDITDLDLGIDGSRIRGGVAVARGERLGLGIGLSIDKLNIDAYLPQQQAASAEPAGETPPSSGETAAPKAGSPLAFLGGFDSVVQLKAGNLTYQGKSIEGVNIDGTLAGGMLELRDASVRSLAGARAKAAGRITELVSAAPSVDLSLEVETQDADRLLQMLNAVPSFKVGAGKLDGTVEGNLDLLNINTKLAALGGEFAARGKLFRLTGDMEFDLALDVKHADASALAARLRNNGSPKGPSAGRLRIAGAVTGTPADNAFSAGVTVGAGSFTLQGQLAGAGGDNMTGSAAVTGEHPDMAKAVRVFAPGFRPALAEPGPLKFSTNLAFDPVTLRIDNLKGNAGPVSFESTANVALEGERPRVTGELKTSEIIVDWFMPARPTQAAGGSSGGSGYRARAERWSTEPIDVSGLRAIDAAINLIAPAITYTDLRVDSPKVTINLDNGVLDLRELSGRAFGGTFDMTGQLAAQTVPSLRYSLNFRDADAARFTGGGARSTRGIMSVLNLVFPISSAKLASGRLSANFDVASQGRSERDLIGALNGKGAVRFTDAVAEGVDLCRISNQLDNLNGLEGFLGLIISAQGGTTRIANYDGRFDITNGIANLPQQRINADCATIDFAGNVDLPRWLIDIQAKAQFPQHPEFPGVVVEQKGPLDQPNTRFVNSNAVQQYIIGRSAGSVLEKIAPNLIPQRAPTSPDTSGSQPAPQPAEQLRGIFRELLRNR